MASRRGRRRKNAAHDRLRPLSFMESPYSGTTRRPSPTFNCGDPVSANVIDVTESTFWMSQNHCQFTGGKLLSRSQTRKRPGRKKGLLNTNSDNASASVFPCVIRRLNTEFDENSANLHLKLTSSDVRENSATDDPSCVDVTTPPRAARCSNPGETYQSLVKLKNKHSSHMFEELSKDSPHLPATPVPSRRRSAGKVLVKDTPVEEYGMTLRTRLQRRRLAKQLEG